MKESDKETFYPATRKEWREWLMENHRSRHSVWLIQYKKSSGVPSITWPEAVEEALCFGWIDSVKKKLDDQRSIQYFCKRKPVSTWSKINKDKVELLISQGLMTPAGLKSIEVAKQNGSWTILDEVEELKIPADLAKAFRSYPGSRKYFLSLSKSSKKGILYWILQAKRPETRQKRIEEVVALAAKGEKPKQF